MIDEEILYKLWLSIVCKHDPKLINKCIEKFGTAEKLYFYEPRPADLIKNTGIGRAVRASRSLDEAKELAKYCEENGIEIISVDDSKYPKSLLEVYSPPQLLYVKGEMPCIDKLVTITIVGSRRCSDYGRRFAEKLSKDLTANGVVVISGMAEGIDTAAHKGALSAGGTTLAVLAGGVDVIYPKSNIHLYNEITSNGAVVSERPPQAVGRGSFYKERNRILVGLSKGVVIVEGEGKSGTKLTANWAVDSDRDLYAVPGRPEDIGAELPNNLIKNNAKLVTGAEDILEEYTEVYSSEISRGTELLKTENPGRVKDEVRAEALPKRKTLNFENYEGKQRIILEYLYENKEAHFDDISRSCDIPARELSVELIGLMMKMIVKELPGEYYTLV